MEVLFVLAAIAVVVVLFVTNSRQTSRIDQLERESKVQASNLDELRRLYSALLAARHVTPEMAPAPPGAPTAAAAPEPETITEAAPLVVEDVDLAETVETPETVAPEPAFSPSPFDDRGFPVSPGSEPVAASAGPWTTPPAPEHAPAAPARTFNWERFIGVSLPIWLGAITLSVAGFFFVRYVIEAGLFTPVFRVLLGILAAAGMLAAAELVRRRGISNGPQISAALAAAAIATLFASSYFASVVFELVPTTAGFLGMAGVTILAIVIALIYGRIVAVVGLIGGYVAPALFGSADPSAPILFGYLGAILVATFVVIRLKDWWAIAVPALLGPLVWIMIWSVLPGIAAQAVWIAGFGVLIPAVVLAAASNAWLPATAPLPLMDAKGRPATVGFAIAAGMAVAALGFLILVSQSPEIAAYWYGLILFAVLTVAAGAMRPAALGPAQLAPLAAAALGLIAWMGPTWDTAALPTALLFVVFALGAGDQFRRLQRPVLWATAVAFVAVFFFGYGAFRVAGWEAVAAQKHLWAVAALTMSAAMLGLLFAVGTKVAPPLAQSRVFAILAGAASAFISLLVVIELDPTLFPAAAALQVLGISVIHSGVRLRGLQVVAAIYGAIYVLLILGAGATAGVSSNSAIAFMLAKPVEEAPFVLLILPGIAFVLAATLFHRAAAVTLAGFLDVAALVLLAWGLVHLILPGVIDEPLRGLYVQAAKIMNPELLLAAAAIYAGRTLGRRALYIAGIVFAGLLALMMIIGLMLPLFSLWPVIDLPGAGILNVAWLALGTPALILLGIGWFVRQDPSRPTANFGRALSVAGVFALFALMMVLIRNAFHPDQLQGETSPGEFYAYSVGTLAFGVALLIGGVAVQNRGARMLSFVFVLAATVKVFLWDAAALEGLWRVLSFLGMGLSFLGISWLYARFVFGLGAGKQPSAAAEPPATPPGP
jgi:uncharacterized membrane protein